MKRQERKWIIAVIAVFAAFFCSVPEIFSKAFEEKHTIKLFFENVCASCHEEDDFYELFNRCISAEEKEMISYEIRTYNVFQSANRAAYEELLAENGKRASDYNLPVLFIDGQWLCGYENMERQLHGILMEGKVIDSYGREEEKASEDASEDDDPLIPPFRLETSEKTVLLFTTYSCEDCREIKEYLEELRTEEDFVLWEENIAEGNRVQLFKELLRIYRRDETEGKVPAAFAGDQVLLGKDEIKERLPLLLADGTAAYGNLKKELAKAEKTESDETVTGGSIAAMFGAGLLAGFNPCAVSMLLMLFSILLTTQESVWKNGAFYLIGKYITYLGLGLGICFAASKIDQQLLNNFGKKVNLILIVLFLFVAIMNFMDFLNVRNQRYGKIRMQLPKGLRSFNHRLLKKVSLMEGALLCVLVLGLGIAVSLGEFFCTGQIYMASILYLLRNAEDQVLPVLGTLMVYVTAMSLPAAAILVVIGRTKKTGQVSDFMLRHMGAIKLLNSALFLIYTIYFAINM